METTKEKSAVKHKTVLINRTFNLSIELVWDAFTNPETFKKWWGPENYSCTICKIDLKVGGKCFADMKNKKTGETMYSVDIYKEIVEREKLVMSDHFADEKGNIIPAPAGMPGDWSKEMIITIRLEDKNDQTAFSLTHEGIPVEGYEDCVKGWNESLDKLERLK